MIKPIQTKYKNQIFRSRLEARWAVFFDYMNVGYRYEGEGYEAGGIKYLPDFYIPDHKLYIEVKPLFPPKKELKKVFMLRDNIGGDCYVGVLYGYPAIKTDNDGFIIGADYCLFLINPYGAEDDQECLFSQCRRCGSFLFRESIAALIPDHELQGLMAYGCCDRCGMADTEELKSAYNNAQTHRFY